MSYAFNFKRCPVFTLRRRWNQGKKERLWFNIEQLTRKLESLEADYSQCKNNTSWLQPEIERLEKESQEWWDYYNEVQHGGRRGCQ